jgi:exosortase
VSNYKLESKNGLKESSLQTKEMDTNLEHATHDLSSVKKESIPSVSSDRPNRFLLCIIAALLITLYAPTISWLWDRWTLSVWHHAHGLLILPVVGYLAWNELKKVRHLPRSSNAMGFIILVPALILHMLDAGMHTQLLSAAALVMALPGLSLLLLGLQRTKEIIFPLLFLAFTLPIPLAFTEHLHMTLRKIATASVSHIIPLFSIPLVVDGTALYIPNGVLQVADACSGFSTLYATVAIACLTAYMSSYMNRRVLVLLLAVPIAITANIIRVTLLVLLVHWTGMEVLGTSLHTISGLFTFVLALPLVFWIGFRRRKIKEET